MILDFFSRKFDVQRSKELSIFHPRQCLQQLKVQLKPLVFRTIEGDNFLKTKPLLFYYFTPSDNLPSDFSSKKLKWPEGFNAILEIIFLF